MFAKGAGQPGFQSEWVGTTMVSEVNTDRFVFRARAGPLCSSECSKMHLCGHREKSETTIGTVYCVFDVCATKVMDPMNHV